MTERTPDFTYRVKLWLSSDEHAYLAARACIEAAIEQPYETEIEIPWQCRVRWQAAINLEESIKGTLYDALDKSTGVAGALVREIATTAIHHVDWSELAKPYLEEYDEQIQARAE